MEIIGSSLCGTDFPVNIKAVVTKHAAILIIFNAVTEANQLHKILRPKIKSHNFSHTTKELKAG